MFGGKKKTEKEESKKHVELAREIYDDERFHFDAVIVITLDSKGQFRHSAAWTRNRYLNGLLPDLHNICKEAVKQVLETSLKTAPGIH
jgi:hypothetical protein